MLSIVLQTLILLYLVRISYTLTQTYQHLQTQTLLPSTISKLNS